MKKLLFILIFLLSCSITLLSQNRFTKKAISASLITDEQLEYKNSNNTTMDTETLKIEINHILETGANDIRFIELIEKVSMQRTSKFMLWVEENKWNKLIGGLWYNSEIPLRDQIKLTTEQVYKLFLKSCD